AHFLLQLSEPLGIAGRGSRPMALVDLGLHAPVPQSLGIDPELLAHTTERSRPRRWIPPRVHGHPRGPLPTLIGVLPRCCHAPHPPVDSEPPPDPGRFNDSIRGFCGRLTRRITRWPRPRPRRSRRGHRATPLSGTQPGTAEPKARRRIPTPSRSVTSRSGPSIGGREWGPR